MEGRRAARPAAVSGCMRFSKSYAQILEELGLSAKKGFSLSFGELEARKNAKTPLTLNIFFCIFNPT